MLQFLVGRSSNHGTSSRLLPPHPGRIPIFKINCQFTVMLTVVVDDNVPDVAVTVAV
jgi:hypothetical protein